MSLWVAGMEAARIKAIAARAQSGGASVEEFAATARSSSMMSILRGAGAQLIYGPGGTHILLRTPRSAGADVANRARAGSL